MKQESKQRIKDLQIQIEKELQAKKMLELELEKLEEKLKKPKCKN